jgi:hypothetical protein
MIEKLFGSCTLLFLVGYIYVIASVKKGPLGCPILEIIELPHSFHERKFLHVLGTFFENGYN